MTFFYVGSVLLTKRGDSYCDGTESVTRCTHCLCRENFSKTSNRLFVTSKGVPIYKKIVNVSLSISGSFYHSASLKLCVSLP